MCYAAAIPWVLAAVSAVGAYQGAQTQKATAQYQSEVARNNASIADIQAADAKARGDKASQDMRRKYAALMGTQRASLAARGLDLSDGSANATLQDTLYFGEADQNTVRANAAREAWGYKVRASNLAGDAGAYGALSDATNPLLSGGAAGAGTLFGSSTGVAQKWFQFGSSAQNWKGMGGTSADPWYG
jgi:hypothetical protein